MKMNVNNKKLNLAFKYFKETCLSNNKKFIHLDEWLYIESRLFKSELEIKPKIFVKYNIGDIVKIEYGVGIGSEISNRHFGVVVSSNDNVRNDSIIIVPLTSKPGNGKIMIGFPILEKYVDIINLKFLEMKSLNIKNVKKIQNLIDEVDKVLCASYVNVSQIRAISKNRIISISKNDKLSNYKLSDDKLKMIFKRLNNILGF